MVPALASRHLGLGTEAAVHEQLVAAGASVHEVLIDANATARADEVSAATGPHGVMILVTGVHRVVRATPFENVVAVPEGCPDQGLRSFRRRVDRVVAGTDVNLHSETRSGGWGVGRADQIIALTGRDRGSPAGNHDVGTVGARQVRLPACRGRIALADVRGFRSGAPPICCGVSTTTHWVSNWSRVTTPPIELASI